MDPAGNGDEGELTELVNSLDHLDSPSMVKCEMCGFRVIKRTQSDSCAECGSSLA